MDNNTFIASLRKTFTDGIALVQKKNADYATASNPFKNFESAAVAGVSIEKAIVVRVLDKLSRVTNLLERPAMVIDESLEDTLLDAINYLAILKARLESNKQASDTAAKVAGLAASSIPTGTVRG